MSMGRVILYSKFQKAPKKTHDVTWSLIYEYALKASVKQHSSLVCIK
jgi:hypothetical protein